MDTASFRFTTDMPAMATRPEDRLPRDSLKCCLASCRRKAGEGGPGTRRLPWGRAQTWRGAPLFTQHFQALPPGRPRHRPLGPGGQAARGPASPSRGAVGRHGGCLVTGGRGTICRDLQTATWKYEAPLPVPPRTGQPCRERRRSRSRGHGWHRHFVYKPGSFPHPLTPHLGFLSVHQTTILSGVMVSCCPL